jgi:hypothetical protein
MAYTDLLEEEGINAQYLAVLRPSRRVVSFTLSSGSVYYNDFTYGYVYSVHINGTALTEAGSTSLSAGQYYYDHEASRLYLRKSDSTAPSGSDYIIVTYELHFGTFDCHWYRNPVDSATTTVYFDPVIQDPPEIKSNVSELLFGVLPVLSTSVRLINAEHIFEKHLYDSSFQNKEILIYHWLDELSTANMKLVQKGRMGNVTYNRGQVSIQIFDNLNVFEKEFRSTQEFLNTTDYPALDPAFVGKPVRTVYGVVDGFVPVNIDFVRDNPATSDNRDWIIRANGSSNNDITRTVPASPSSTTTRTYVDDATGFKVGDSVWLDKTTDEYRTVTVVDHGTNYIEHAALSSGAATTGNTVKRGTVGNLFIVQNGVRYVAHYNRDYTLSVHASGALQMTLSSSLESNLSMPATLSSTDQLYCRVYGKQNAVTLSGSPFGSNSTNYNNLCSLEVILFDILKTYVGLTESEINLTSFTALNVEDEIGIAIPDKASANYPKVKDVIVKLLKSGLVRLYLDFDQKWKVSALSPITSTSKDITDDEIIRGSIDYDFDYSDVYSDIVVTYNVQETSETGSENYNLAKVSSSLAKYLHGVSKTFSHESLHIDSSGATTLATRLAYTLGDRQGVMTLGTKNRFFDNTVSDDISVSSEKLPGYDYDGVTENSRDFKVQQIEKSLRRVKIVLSDQKGIQDNSGSW